MKDIPNYLQEQPQKERNTTKQWFGGTT